MFGFIDRKAVRFGHVLYIDRVRTYLPRFRGHLAKKNSQMEGRSPAPATPREGPVTPPRALPLALGCVLSTRGQRWPSATIGQLWPRVTIKRHVIASMNDASAPRAAAYPFDSTTADSPDDRECGQR
jgi:hypothetical protein